MSKQSLLEVDFDHLAWKPFDSSMASHLDSAIKPIEMARGKNEVYLKVIWETETQAQVKEVLDFKKIFDEIDRNRKDDVSDKFLGSVEGNLNAEEKPIKLEPKNTKIEEPVEPSIDDMINAVLSEKDEDFDEANTLDAEEISEISSKPEEELTPEEKEKLSKVKQIEESEYEDYSPNEKYNYYVINVENKIIDSGWEKEEEAKDRLSSIEEEGAEHYSIQKYSTKLLKIVGDPTTREWNPFGSRNFYIINNDRQIVDSAFDNKPEAENRLKEIANAISEFDREFGDEELSISDEYSIIKKDQALETLGYSVTYKGTYEPVEDIIKALRKHITSALMEATLSEPTTSDDYFYLIFGFGPDFSPEDDSGRVGHSDEYSELEIYLDKLVAFDGTTVTSKELRKASDKIKVKKPYQSTIKLLNHTSTYLYNSLGFGNKEIDINNAKEETYKLGSEEKEQYPRASVNDTYANSITPSKKIDPDIDYLKEIAKGIKVLPKTTKIAKEEISENASHSEKLRDYIERNYSEDKKEVMLSIFNKDIAPILEQIPNAENLYKQIMNELESDSNKVGGHTMNNPITRGTSNFTVGFKGVPFILNDEYKKIKNDLTEILSSKQVVGLPGKYQKAKKLFKQKFGFDYDEKLKQLNKEIESKAR